MPLAPLYPSFDRRAAVLAERVRSADCTPAQAAEIIRDALVSVFVNAGLHQMGETGKQAKQTNERGW